MAVEPKLGARRKGRESIPQAASKWLHQRLMLTKTRILGKEKRSRIGVNLPLDSKGRRNSFHTPYRPKKALYRNTFAAQPLDRSLL